jgi:ABC-type iron transport system FetAB permease component
MLLLLLLLVVVLLLLLYLTWSPLQPALLLVPLQHVLQFLLLHYQLRPQLLVHLPAALLLVNGHCCCPLLHHLL